MFSDIIKLVPIRCSKHGLLWSVVCGLVFAQQSLAETMYVHDQLEVTLRSGESTRHSIVRMLHSGTPVEVLETNPETGYSRIIVGNGTEGWALTRFLMNEPAARDQLVNAKRRVETLTAEKKQLEGLLEDLRNEKREIEEQRALLETKNKDLSGDLTQIQYTAANALTIADENKTLSDRLESIRQQLETLQQENKTLKDRTGQNWFMVGSGVTLGGILLGLILPRIRWRRKSRWGSL